MPFLGLLSSLNPWLFGWISLLDVEPILAILNQQPEESPKKLIRSIQNSTSNWRLLDDIPILVGNSQLQQWCYSTVASECSYADRGVFLIHLNLLHWYMTRLSFTAKYRKKKSCLNSEHHAVSSWSFPRCLEILEHFPQNGALPSWQMKVVVSRQLKRLRDVRSSLQFKIGVEVEHTLTTKELLCGWK